MESRQPAQWLEILGEAQEQPATPLGTLVSQPAFQVLTVKKAAGGWWRQSGLKVPLCLNDLRVCWLAQTSTVFI